MINLEKNAQIDLGKALNIEEMFWLEKSKLKWFLEGDRNISYFHKMTKVINTTKMIHSIGDGDNILTKPTKISNHNVFHFTNIFYVNNFLKENKLVVEVMENHIDDQTNLMLIRMPSREEIMNDFFL